MTTRIFYPAEVRPLAWVQEQVRQAAPGLQWYPTDRLYRIPAQADFLTLLNWDWTDKAPRSDLWPESDEFPDCEDYALRVASEFRWRLGLNNVGYVHDLEYSPMGWDIASQTWRQFMYPHAYNLVLLVDALPQVLEPQNDRLLRPGDEGYGMRRGMLLL